MNMKVEPCIQTEPELEEILTRPTERLIEVMKNLSNPLVILGAGGKMGPTLSVLARRAAEAAGHPLRIVAVSRFSDAQARRWLEDHGIETVALDLFNRAGWK